MSKTQEKDQGIMLFGRKIPLLPQSQIPAISTDIMDPKQEKNSSDSMDDNNTKKGDSQHNDDEAATVVNSNNHAEENGTNEEEDEDDHKTMKKPDKIIQCPRCKSMDTKFCYFNNYNVNQPRHFCKNCQRYWTAGGTMRNVPVGAGRRKHKHLPSQFRTVLVAAAAAGVQESTNSSSKENNDSNNGSGGTVLKFGHENLSINYCAEYGGEESSSSLMCESSSEHNNNNVNNDTSKLLQCYPVVPPWVMPWNNVVPQHHHGPNSIQWCPTPMVAAVAATIPVHLVPGPYWGGTPMWGAPIGSNHHSRSSPSSSTSNNSSCSGNGNNNNSPILGKRNSDHRTGFIDEQKSSKCFLVPKIPTRIDESNNNEGSVSPIWATLAMIHDNNALKKIAANGEQGKESLLHVTEILEANPTPISRPHAYGQIL